MEEKRAKDEGTVSIRGKVDDLITEYLMKHEGKATWSELKKARQPTPLQDYTLGEAIKRMVRKGVIIERVERPAGKQVIVYCLSKEVPVFWQDGEWMNLPEWVSTVISDIEAALERDKQKAIGPSGDEFEFWLARVDAPETNKIQAEAVAKALEMLLKEIAGLLKAYSQQPDDEKAMQSLAPAVIIYLAVLIKEAARLVSPRYGSASTAINTALAELFGDEKK